ncbi:MAG: hypothetical protein KAS12_04000 [Candidatus Aenigmarchaeota archaeon]|nr:hypothetical protein [Candidatus Aenigmarchaeota archaeon]
MENTGKKAGPGRPRKRPILPHLAIRGIVEKPEIDDSIVELDYHNPILFRKLITLLKALSVNDVYINFLPDKMRVVARDHFMNSFIVSEIYGVKLNKYYCKENAEIAVRREVLENIFHTVDKVYNRISLRLKKNTIQSSLFITLHQFEINKNDHYEIDLITPQKIDEDIDENIDEYPISFELPSKHFKKIINDMSSMATKFAIEKVGNDPLKITFQNPKSVKCISEYLDGGKIQLVSKIEENAIFGVSIKLENIKLFSGTNTSEVVKIYSHPFKHIVFRYSIDNDTCVIKIYTQIINSV